MKLDRKVALVTGASGGIGKAIAIDLLERAPIWYSPHAPRSEKKADMEGTIHRSREND